jgi:glyoxylase-like metal-dependent hydrolase (beta-lactamase superfamily II)
MMKNLKKMILRITGAIAAVIIVIFGSYMIVMFSAVRKMTPAETSKLTDDVFAVRDKYVNLYLVRCGDDFIAIDAGIKKGSVSDELRKLEIDPDRVIAVFLTHTDSDHAGAINLFRNAVVYLHREEEQMINGETGRFLFFGNTIDTEDYTLINDEVLRIGDLEIRPVLTPGHTGGATCYVVNGSYLFTGDAMRLYNGYAEPFPRLINKNARRARKSMKNIMELEGIQYIFTGHYGYSDDFSKAFSSR